MIEFLDKLYNANKFNSENRQILAKYIRWNMIVAKITTLVFLSTSIFCICAPVVIFFVTGSMEPVLPAHIPFVPFDTFSGYAIHSAIFSIVVMTGYCGTLSNEAFLITVTLHLLPLTKILDQCVIGLNEATGGIRKDAVKNSTWLHVRMRNIALLHKEIYL